MKILANTQCRIPTKLNKTNKNKIVERFQSFIFIYSK